MSVPQFSEPARRRRPRIGAPLFLIAAAGVTGLVLTGGPAAADDPAKARAFTSCMRSHGVPDFPGVTISSDGRVNLTGGEVSLFSARYQAAAEACDHLLPEGSRFPARPRPPAPTPPTAPSPPLPKPPAEP